MRILAIDWGMATGLAFWDDGEHTSWIEPWDVALDQTVPLFVYAAATPPALSRAVNLVVCEDFEIGPRTIRSGVTKGWKRGRELMFIGATEFMTRQTDTEFVLQSPSDAKAFASNDKLKRLGWHKPGPDHANDASRHLLLALVNRRLIDPRELLP